jgi:predicted DNA-binding transcriptional regulator AlpA
MNKSTQLLSPRDVAAMAGYTNPVSVVRAWKRGDLKGFKLNSRAIRFTRLDVERWLVKR